MVYPNLAKTQKNGVKVSFLRYHLMNYNAEFNLLKDINELEKILKEIK